MKPLAMCVMWSLLCDRPPAPDVKSDTLSNGTPYVLYVLKSPYSSVKFSILFLGNMKSASAIAATYGDKSALRVLNGVQIFVAHRGVKCILESFDELSGGPIQPLMQLVMKECQNESSTQQVVDDTLSCVFLVS